MLLLAAANAALAVSHLARMKTMILFVLRLRFSRAPVGQSQRTSAACFAECCLLHCPQHEPRWQLAGALAHQRCRSQSEQRVGEAQP